MALGTPGTDPNRMDVPTLGSQDDDLANLELPTDEELTALLKSMPLGTGSSVQ